MGYNLEFVDTEDDSKAFSFPSDIRDHVPKNGDVVEINEFMYVAVKKKYKYSIKNTFGKLDTITVYLEHKGS